MSDVRVYVDAGDRTEELIQAIYDGLKSDQNMEENAALDAMDVERENALSGGVVNEPITVAAVLTFSATLTVTIARLIEKHWEYKHQERVLKIVVEQQNEGKNVKPLVDIAKADGRVRVEVSKTLPAISKEKP